MTNTLDVYTDGACELNGRSDAYAGAAAFSPKLSAAWHTRSVSLPDDPTPTSSRAELHGLILAAQLADDYTWAFGWRETEVEIKTDSTYMYNTFREGGWLEMWKAKGKIRDMTRWGLSDGAEFRLGYAVANGDLVDNFVQVVESFKGRTGGRVKVVKVAREENVVADRLARQAAERALQRRGGQIE